MRQRDKTFQTQDLNLSAVLISKNFKLIAVKKSLTSKSIFVFFADNEIEEVIKEYWNNELLINPQELFHSLKVLKSRIYSNY